MNNYTGLGPGELKVISNDLVCVFRKLTQYRFPKSKKSRIRKKWKKQNKNHRVQDHERIIKIDNTIIVSTRVYKQLQELPQKKYYG